MASRLHRHTSRSVQTAGLPMKLWHFLLGLLIYILILAGSIMLLFKALENI